MQSLSQLFPKELEWVPYHFSEVFKENSEVDCIAHRSGLQLLFVALVRERYELLQDVYRFLEMEVWVNKVAEFQEARHVEAGEALPQEFLVDHVLTVLCLNLLHQGNVHRVITLFQHIEFAWNATNEEMEVENYAESLDILLEGSHWIMRMEQRESEDILISEPREDGVSEADMEQG